ncbi:hypothetical protein NDN08_007512 [Rhodosorus marinus]|uniref:Haem-binding uptake Tiki superfamily ChaN domain-containing protein n=1 Tax=Rhodosorus marinus TaxID=101924 RepID=A0AAV8UXS5_9RHOD|nr:hypothetical protein NDN08_007512 [Rhodosorus marinus]
MGFVSPTFTYGWRRSGDRATAPAAGRRWETVRLSLGSAQEVGGTDDNEEPFLESTWNRRDFLSMGAGLGAAGLGLPDQADARFLGDIFKGEGKDVFQRTSFIYDVDQFGLKEVSFGDALSRLAKKNVVLLGDHKNSLADHLLSARLIKELKLRRGKVAVALQEVQGRFQPALESYIQGRIGEDKLYKVTQWKNRSTVPFDNFLGIFWICRRYNIPMIAANAETEVLDKVRSSGLQALSQLERRRTVVDPEGFAKSLNDIRFPSYEKAVIAPTFNILSGKGLLGKQPDPKNYFSSRILCDEAIATNIALFMQQHPDTLVIAVMNNDRIKYELGVPDRVLRVANSVGVNNVELGSVLLNLTTSEAGVDPRTNSLRTSYEVITGDPEMPSTFLRLCDMIWYANPANLNAEPGRKRSGSLLF